MSEPFVVKLRPANRHDYNQPGSDCRKQFDWRNQPEVYQGFYSQKGKLEWDDHVRWWLSRKNWEFLVVVANRVDVGMVTLGQLDTWCPQVGLYVGDVAHWGKGIGRYALKLALEHLRKKGYAHVQTTILNTNERSLKLFLGEGFAILRDGRPGEHWAYKEL